MRVFREIPRGRLAALVLFGMAHTAASAAQPLFGTSVFCGAQETYTEGGWRPPLGYDMKNLGGAGFGSTSATASALGNWGGGYADLSTGRMGTGALAGGHSDDPTLVYAWGNAEMWDLVTIFRNDSPATRIPLRFAVDGVMLGNAGTTLDVWLDDVGTRYRLENGVTTVDESLLCPLTESFTFRMRVSLFSSAALNDTESGTSYADFTHTLRTQWELPAGMTFTSASGVFSPAPMNPVPEPGALPALGLGAAGLARRRRARLVS